MIDRKQVEEAVKRIRGNSTFLVQYYQVELKMLLFIAGLYLDGKLVEPKEITPKMLHDLYLEATAKLRPESYNPKAQKPYEELTDEQKFIDEYIAKALVGKIAKKALEDK